MEIKIVSFKDGARNAKGLCVVIDVFRACSVLCYVASMDPAELIIAYDLTQLADLQMKKKNPFSIGRSHRRTEPLFDVVNSPSKILVHDLRNRIVLHHSEGGIAGLAEANRAKEVITGSFVNARAVAEYILKSGPKLVTLVCMGYLGKEEAPEDESCARYIKSLVLNEKIENAEIQGSLMSSSGSVFFKSDDNFPEADFYYCTDFNRFNFVLRRERQGGILLMKKIAN
jgi:2-phosphosulfolactate phosphatase